MPHKTPEERAAYQKAYYDARKPQKQEQSRQRYYRNRESRIASMRHWQEEHQDEIKAGRKRDYQAHREWRLEQAKLFYQRKGETQRKQNRNKLLKDRVYSHYGRACVCCGEKNPAVLTLDHINNDGAEHRRAIGKDRARGGGIYDWIIKNNFPPIFQVLCYNCNCAKGKCGPHRQRISDHWFFTSSY